VEVSYQLLANEHADVHLGFITDAVRVFVAVVVKNEVLVLACSQLNISCPPRDCGWQRRLFSRKARDTLASLAAPLAARIS
jgi:hypothetical protein